MQAADIRQQLTLLEKQYALRQRKLIQSPQGVTVVIDNKSYLSFCSNDYLGLANHPGVCEASIQAIKTYGVGSGASQLVSGYSQLHHQLEESMAEFLAYEKVILFSSGFLANLGVLTALGTRDTLILEDKLNHASLIDGARYSEAALKRYRHRDYRHAQQLLQESHAPAKIIVTDGIFSMQGSVAPLKELSLLCNKQQSLFIVDDAHGIGVFGQHGRGSLELQNLSADHVDILIGTFGKAFGSAGAFVAGNKEMIEFILQKARTLTYSTAMPVALAAAALHSLKIIINDGERRKRLHANIQYFRQQAVTHQLQIEASTSPIQTIMIGDNLATLEASEMLASKNILVIAIRPPTVPPNTARLRITLSSEHNQQQIDQLINSLLEI